MMRHYSRLAGATLCASVLLQAQVSGPVVVHAAKAEADPQAMQTQSSDFIRSLQRQLKRAGHDPGAVDGRMGPATRQALRQFQEAHGLPPTGDLDIPTLTKLLEQGQAE